MPPSSPLRPVPTAAAGAQARLAPDPLVNLEIHADEQTADTRPYEEKAFSPSAPPRDLLESPSPRPHMEPLIPDTRDPGTLIDEGPDEPDEMPAIVGPRRNSPSIPPEWYGPNPRDVSRGTVEISIMNLEEFKKPWPTMKQNCRVFSENIERDRSGRPTVKLTEVLEKASHSHSPLKGERNKTSRPLSHH